MEFRLSQTELVSRLASDIDSMKLEIGKRIIGQQDVIENIIVCLLSGGHCLLV